MLRIKTFGTLYTGKVRLDLVKAWGHVAHIKGIEWCFGNNGLNADQRQFMGFSIQDYESSPTPVGTAQIYENDYCYSTYAFISEIEAGGGMSVLLPNKYIDLLPFDLKVVCPVTMLAYSATGTAQMWCRVYFEVIPASRGQIIESAALQGLNMEV